MRCPPALFVFRRWTAETGEGGYRCNCFDGSRSPVFCYFRQASIINTEMMHMTTSPITFLRRPTVEARTGRKRSALYQAISDGTFPKPVPLGARAVGWPEHEVQAVQAARLAGANDEAIKALVTELHQARGAGAHVNDQAAA
jgi:prophage regulatory protein